MNEQLKNFAKTQLKDGLKQLPDNMQTIFKRIYSPDNLELSIDEVVNNIPQEKLDWAMRQVENSLQKIDKVSL
jgi:hypothetical protein